MTAIEDLRALEDALQLLAADADAQAPALGAFRRVAEEIGNGVVELRHLEDMLAAAGLVPAAVCDEVARIDAALDEMIDDDAQWTPEALEASPQWERVRRHARAALHGLGAERRPPTLPEIGPPPP